MEPPARAVANRDGEAKVGLNLMGQIRRREQGLAAR